MRDKFLTEAMGECWHEIVGQTSMCACGVHIALHRRTNTNFSTWEGFGKLKEFAEKQEWWDKFKRQMCGNAPFEPLPEYFINPDRFADTVFEYLKEGSDDKS